MSKKPEIWTQISVLFPPSDSDLENANRLLAVWHSQGRIRALTTELLDLPLSTLAAFYCALPETPPETGIVVDSITFVNTRALGRGSRKGNFLDVARIIPGLGTKGIHLAPFTPYDHKCLYAITSYHSIASQVSDLELETKGITRNDQLHALISASHRLGISVGFDLEPHTAQFSIPVVSQPRWFRWVRIVPETGVPCWAELRGPSDQTPEGVMQRMLDDDVQESIAKFVDNTRLRLLEVHGLNTLEFSTEPEKILADACYRDIVRTLLKAGYWTVTTQIWCGEGIPVLKGKLEGSYPSFYYWDRNGNERADLAFGVLTPLRFDRPNGYAQVFPWWRDKYGFDFVRFDSLDHIFDSCDSWDTPRSDRPAPVHLAQAVKTARPAWTLAERMGTDWEPYAKTGFDLILGDDMLWNYNEKLVQKTLLLGQSLQNFNKESKMSIHVCAAIDTHDTEDPGILGAHLTTVRSRQELIGRQFLARFGACGDGIRPLYTIVGMTDRSTGLHTANISDSNMNFGHDRERMVEYHALEVAWKESLKIIKSGTMVPGTVDRHGSWWTISSTEGDLFLALALPDGHGLGVHPSSHISQGPVKVFRVNDRQSIEYPTCPEQWYLHPGECLIVMSLGI